MSHANILLPHPIIRPEGFDYGDHHFSMNIEQAMYTPDGKIHLELSHDLSSSTINNLIKEKKAKFFVLLKCTKTYQRFVYSSIDICMSLDLSLSDFASALNVIPYVATVEEIPSFHSNEHDDEIKKLIPDGFNLPVGAILAVGHSHEITIDSIDKIQAAIKIVQGDELPVGHCAIDTESDFITIRMHPKIKHDILDIRKNSPGILYPSIYMIAIEHAILDMEENSDRKWARALRETLEKHNIEIDNNLKNNALEHAQTILRQPLNRIIEWKDGSDEFD